jgi:peptide chain release factor 1
MNLLEKLKGVEVRFNEVSQKIIDPDVIADMRSYVQYNKEYKDLEPIVGAYNEYRSLLSNITQAEEILNDEPDDEMKELAELELEESRARIDILEEEIKVLLIPKDPEDSKNAVVEVRAGTGGDEAGIFAGDLYRMYQRYCDRLGWKTELMDYTEGSSGGFKEVIFAVHGENAYGIMKYESGVHRVQRVPQTETQGRVHTSAATVAVLPEAEEFDVEINMNDVRKETYCSSGPGGQSVNTTYSAVRLTHIPTGVVAQCQDQKSQIKNFDKALKVLRSRIYEIELTKRNEEIASKRKSMVSTGDRSAKIRTYNYPQGRVTDHRIGLTLYNLGDIMNGDLAKITEELKVADNAERMKESWDETN